MELNPLIQTKTDLEKNIQSVEKYLTVGTDYEFQEMVGYIQRGTCFVVYQSVNGQFGFVPSKFIGHLSNSIEKHSEKMFHGGGETNIKISNILGDKECENEDLEGKYLQYCNDLNVIPYSKTRKYWKVLIDKPISDSRKDTELEEQKMLIISEDVEFEEGQMLEKWHKFRERNPTLIRKAKQNFKIRNEGRLFCEACGFDFEKTYGKLGENFIEGHHLKPISIRKKGEPTNSKDIAMLCSNCHKMIHKKRPWIEKREELKSLLNN